MPKEQLSPRHQHTHTSISYSYLFGDSELLGSPLLPFPQEDYGTGLPGMIQPRAVHKVNIPQQLFVPAFCLIVALYYFSRREISEDSPC